jgi:23S rRNA (cytosine1962-C5)-methyltransferase
MEENMSKKKQVSLTVKNKWVRSFDNKNPLIQKEAILNVENLKEEGSIVNVYDEKSNFIGKGYYGEQNKGCGWIVSREKNIVLDTNFFSGLFTKSINRRNKFYNDNTTTSFRIFNGEGDGFGGFTIDNFDDYYMITWYNKGVYKFKDLIITALMKVVSCKGIYEKKRFDKEGKYVEANDFVRGEKAPEPLIVLESGVKFAIYLNDGPMVGVFLDQREVRKTIRDKYAKNKTVLNTFSYTGAFSVFAALGGASMTTSVDLASRSKQKTMEQFEINDIDPNSQEIEIADVFDYFKFAANKKKSFDLVILDPPSFARSKKRTFSVAKDYVKLLVDAINITNSNGVIVASTNYSNFNMKKFKSFIDLAFKDANMKYQILETYSLPKDFYVSKDFPEGNYLKVVFIKKLS